MDKQTLISQLKQKKTFILAIDGMSGAGKSTFAHELHRLLGGNLFHMDDFFLPMHKRTQERLREPGGNVDYERFLETVLLPLSKHQDVTYQRFDCSKMALDKKVIIPYHPINIIEGSYALHPTLKDYYSDAVVLIISPQKQKERIKKRSPDKYDQFINIWIPLENQYFEYFHLKELYPTIKVS